MTCKSHPNKTLEQHIAEIREIFEKLLEFYEIKPSSEEKKVFEYLIKLHDIGKCRKEFQDYIRDLEKGINRKSPGSHSLWSLEEIEKILPLDIDKKYLPLLFYLIAKHHSNLKLEFANEFPEQISKLILLSRNVKPLKDLVISLAQKIKEYYLNYLKQFDKNELIKVADIFGLFKIADTLSAKNAIGEISKIIRKAEINEYKVRKLIKSNLDERRWLVQKELSKYDHLILRAPTGWGKTTTSLLFTLNKDYKKVFITLPTITAIEKFYRDLKDVFLNDVEMYFYFYDAYLSLENELEEKLNMWFYIKNLYYPINITTVDQILLSFLQAGKYFLKRVNLRKSIIILDEVHLLTPQMLFLLKKFLEHLVPLYKIKLLLMSATLPKGIVEYLFEELNFETIDIYGLWNKKYFEEKYYNRERVEFELINRDVLEDLERIVEENEKGKSVLVILNTVEKAVAVYKKLKEEYNIENILLLHGRFMFKHRWEREKKIKNICKDKDIFVSTQVSEVSLDIDFDVLFTELAPISSLIQRAGRVNRYGSELKAKVYVYYPSEIKEMKEDRRKKYPYDINEMEKTWNFLEKLDNFKEGELIKRIDETFTKDFYESLIKKDNIYSAYRGVFEDREKEYNVHWFLTSISEEKGKELLDFRENVTTLIIPYGSLLAESSLKEEVSKLIEDYNKLKEESVKYDERLKFFAERVKPYAVSIPLWILANIDLDKKSGFPVIEKLPEGLEYKYFSEYGFVNLEKLKKFGIDMEGSIFI